MSIHSGPLFQPAPRHGGSVNRWFARLAKYAVRIGLLPHRSWGSTALVLVHQARHIFPPCDLKQWGDPSLLPYDLPYCIVLSPDLSADCTISFGGIEVSDQTFGDEIKVPSHIPGAD